MARVLAIFLDGYEQSLGQRLMSAGEMPEMSRLAAASGRFLLESGPAQRTGLAGEHVATGLSPEAAQRWSAVDFDPRSYAVWQEGTRLPPFPTDLASRTVVFDAPYFDLERAAPVNGLVGWGAHDPGVPPTSRPEELRSEFDARFGAYPADRWVYGFAWPSAEDSGAMGRELARAVDVRAEAAHWLLAERIPDWDLALVVVSEPHSAVEGLWHGIDPTHPLHHLPSASPAGAGVLAVYQAVDRLVGKLTAAFPDAITIVFALGGMGINRSDVPSMLLLPELLYRKAFGSPLYQQPREWDWPANGAPMLLAEGEVWGERIAAGFPDAPEPPLRRFAARVLPRPIKTLIRRATARAESPEQPQRYSLAWMPATAYQRFWRSMPAFALPSFYDGRARVNLVGREGRGMVGVENYQRTLAEVEQLVRDCIDPATGQSAVDFVERQAPEDPRAAGPTQADLVFVWKGAATCFEHPSLGRIGPVPFRRTGGHTGPFGMAYVRADNCAVGDLGIRSGLDVVPTIVELMGEPRRRSLSGTSLLEKIGV